MFIFDIVAVCFLIVFYIFIQFLFSIPIVYSVSVTALLILTSSFMFMKYPWYHVELILLTVWVVIAGWYLREQSVAVLLVYLISRVVGDGTRFFVSHVDRLFGVYMRYVISSVVLISGFVIVTPIRWYVMALCSVVFIGAASLFFRRYDLLDGEESVGV